MANIKEILDEHKEEYQMLSFAIVNSVATLIYTEFIRRMKRKTQPVPCVHIPRIAAVQEICSMNNPLMKRLSNELFSTMKINPRISVFPSTLINVMNNESCSIILNGYILPIICNRLPDIIRKKFQLDTDQQIFREDISIDMFERNFGTDQQVKYVADEAVLQCAMILVPPTEAEHRLVVDDNILISIDNHNAIAPIIIDQSIIGNQSIFETICFVTNIKMESIDGAMYMNTGATNVVKSIAFRRE